jgi:hypothetical protein
MHAKRYLWFFIFLLVLDWGWGIAQVRGLVPLWSFAVLNFPFGLPYVWIESHWVGTHYEVSGRTVDELWSMGMFVFMVVAQSILYRGLWDVVLAARRSRSASS